MVFKEQTQLISKIETDPQIESGQTALMCVWGAVDV